MGDILRNWIRARLGIAIDLGPKVFGHYTKDGRLLAQILLSYDIISRDQLDTITVTHDPALCRVNLKHLRFWLRFLGIECDDESVEEISCGNGTASLRLFYKVYLCLETKDRLHFITLQKEREKFVPASRKFDVTRVSEDPPAYEPPEHPRSRKLLEGKAIVVGWHRSKFPAILRKLKRERRKLEVPAWEPYPIVQPVEHDVPERSESEEHERMLRDSADADRFARETTACESKRTEMLYEERTGMELAAVAADPEMARAYVERLKRRGKRAATVSALKTKTRNALLHELWDRIAADREKRFDEAIARRTLDRSRYEKRIATKLCEVRDQRNAMLENRKILEDMTEKANEVEYLASVERRKDSAAKNQRDAELECERMCELRRRLAEEKVREMKERHRTVCRETVQEMVSLALKIEDYRQMGNGVVPQSIVREWFGKFVRGETREEEGLDQAAMEEAIEEASNAKLQRMELLRDALLDDYLDAKPPWDQPTTSAGESAEEFAEESATTRLGRAVLGYAVHRLLNYVHPVESVAPPTPMTEFEVVAIVLGIANPTAHESLRRMLENSGIRLVRMEDAINYCLDRYKREMPDAEYVDARLVAATTEFAKELESGERRAGHPKLRNSVSRSTESHGHRQSRRSASSGHRDESKSADTQDKQTQTPGNVPYEDPDPVLTDSARIGKWAYEFLALGQPIANELATEILVGYLKSLRDLKGWALIDYPNTYEQMSLLETALTGFKIPPDPETLEFEDFTVEDVQSVAPRIVYEDRNRPVDAYRRSRLVPCPIGRIRDIPTPTFADLFVRAARKPPDFRTTDPSSERLTGDSPSVDKFYGSRMIGYFLYYDDLDETTLKRLARLVIGESSRSKTSVELFGDSPRSRERGRARGTGSKAPVVRRMLPESRDLADSDRDREIAERTEEREWEREREREREPPVPEEGREYEFEPELPKPGERDWEWIDLPLPSPLVEILANLWDSLEEAYTGNLKELLFLKSVHASGVVPYTEFLAKSAAEYVARPDNKQDRLNEFHSAFNEIDEDARQDQDVKCELHRRLADFQGTLWDVCDRRRREAEEERRRFIDDEWTVHESTVLFNVYVGIVQAELDRCVDTINLILDYYAAMSGESLSNARFPKAILNRTATGDVELVDERVAAKPAGRRQKRAETESESKKTSPATLPALDQALLRRQIGDLLTDRNKVLEDASEIDVVEAIAKHVRFARNVVDDLAAAVWKREEERAAGTAGKDVSANGSGREQDVALERRYALVYEIDRVTRRFESIEAAARNEFVFLLETMQTAFHRIYDNILNRYWREVKSVNEMANVFCFAIEDGKCLEKEMLLDGDRFVIRSNVYVKRLAEKEPAITEEADTGTRFRVARLFQLMETFRRVSPHGTMPERAFVRILQDLISHGTEEGESSVLPCCWYRLRSSDVVTLVRRLFESASRVDWREFVIYATDLPMPSPRDILIARDRFRVQDSDLKEVVTVDRFLWTPVWFLECVETTRDAFRLLRDDFQRSPEELYEEELYRFDRDAISIDRSLRNSNQRPNDSGDCVLTEETLRLTLIKELLCRMYMIDRRTVNYTALLLAFCKAEDPREGFAKALALAIGTRVCVDVEQGERYVDELRRRGDESSRESLPGSNREMDDSSTTGSALGENERERRSSDEEPFEYRVPFDVCLTVLSTALPSQLPRPEVYGPAANLRDSLISVYRDLKDEDLDDRDDAVLAHRLLNHPFVKRLLNSTSKFTAKNVGSIVQEIILSR